MRSQSTAKIALIVFAIVEAILISGIVVTAVLKKSSAGDRPVLQDRRPS